MKPFLLYESKHFIVIYKPCGVEMHHPQDGIIHQSSHLSDASLYLVHRLDKMTSGLLLLAKNADWAAKLSALFKEHAISKGYIALSDKKPKKKQGTVVGDMQKSRNGSYKLVRDKLNPAHTSFNSRSIAPQRRLFNLRPKTGKTHQLRVALKSLGSPILGDDRYGGSVADRLYLHALSLAFCVNGKEYFFLSPILEGELWNNDELKSSIYRQATHAHSFETHENLDNHQDLMRQVNNNHRQELLNV